MKDHIAIHAAAPEKPAMGDTCNGCGVCCLAAPCPAGILLTGRLSGACRLLEWDAAEQRYRCGLLTDAGRHVRPRALANWVTRRAPRWIATGIGCDTDIGATSIG